MLTGSRATDGQLALVHLRQPCGEGLFVCKVVPGLGLADSSPLVQVVLHVDTNSSPAYRRRVSEIALTFVRVSLVTHPVPCNWGGASVQPAVAPT